jgi:Ca-activated chloride channel family protein
MGIDHPWLLVLLGVLPVSVWWALTSVSGHTKVRLALATGCRGLALIALVLAMAGFRIGSDSRPATVFLVDTSDSMLASQWLRSREIIDNYLAATHDDTHVGVVQFGAETEVLSVPQRLQVAPELSGGVDGRATDYTSAVAVGLGLLDPVVGGQIVLISDGAGDSVALETAAGHAAARGVPISVVPVNVVRTNDVSLLMLEVPEKVRVGAKPEVRVWVESQRETSARLRIWDGRQLVSDASISIAAGTHTYRVGVLDLVPGFHRLRGELLRDGDSRLSNNVAEAFLHVLDSSNVLVVGAADDVAAALVFAGRQVRLIPPDEFFIDDLKAHDVVVLVDVSAEALGTSAVDALRSYVAAGHGLIVIGGPHSYAVGGYQGTAFDDVLPVWSEPTEDRPEPRLALVLVIDKSTSMAVGTSEGNAKFDLAIEAAIDAIELLAEGDILGVMAFDLDAQWVVPPRELTSASQVAEVIERIRGIKIGTSTDLYRAMFFTRARLDLVDASIKHVVLLTDGRAQSGDFESLTRSMRRRDMTVSTIAIGKDSDQKLLRNIARIGSGRYYFVPDPEAIPQVLTQEARTAGQFAIAEYKFQPKLRAASPIFSGELSGQVLPDLTGFVRTRPKPEADLVLVSDRNDPILAQWQFGRGRAVSWTSDGGADWARDWRDWKMFSEFIGQAVDWAAPPPGGNRWGTPHVETRYTDGLAQITVDLIDTDGRFVNELDLEISVVGPDGQGRMVDAVQSSPGRYRAEVRDLLPGVYEIQVEVPTLTDGMNIGLGGLVVSASNEIRHVTADPHVLDHVAMLTGGVKLVSIEDVGLLPKLYVPENLFDRYHLLIISLVMFIVDVGIRRLLGGPREIRGRLNDRVRSARGMVWVLRGIRRFISRPA